MTPAQKRTSGTASPAFKVWFAGSKVVDADGKPLVVYHGGNLPSTIESGPSRGGLPGEVAYFTSSEFHAGEYSRQDQGKVEKFYLNISNPAYGHTRLSRQAVELLLPSVDIESYGGWDEFVKFVDGTHGNTSASLNAGDGVLTEGKLAMAFPVEYASYMEDAGIDGFIFEDLEGDGITFVPAWKPTQIKRIRETTTNPSIPKTLDQMEEATRLRLEKEYGYLLARGFSQEDAWLRILTMTGLHGPILAGLKKRLGVTTNPAPAPAKLQKRVFDAMKASAKKNVALRVDELAERIKAKVEDVAAAMRNLAAMGLAHEAGRDLFGPCWLPGAPSRGLFDNPNPRAKAEKKARAWFGKDSLVTKAQEIDWTPPESAVHIGQFIAIEYLSDKFDGVKRIYRHDVTKVRQMLLSPDGSTIIVDPPFKITKRGIEG